MSTNDPVGMVNALGAVWSPTLDAHVASGGAVPLVCVLCQVSPCACPPFGSDEYLAMFARRHGRT